MERAELAAGPRWTMELAVGFWFSRSLASERLNQAASGSPLEGCDLVAAVPLVP